MAKTLWWSSLRFSAAILLLLTTSASAATSFSNPLTGFTGDSSQASTQAALAAAGFNVFSVDFGPAVQFDASGARFGALTSGDDGRNYMRTNDADYANVSFVAEITIVVPDLDSFDEVGQTGPPYQSGWFGMGSGDTALFGWPDWSTQFSSVMVVPEKFDNTRYLTTMYTQNDINQFANNDVPALDNGTHRLRLVSLAELAVFSIDLNYAGGPFVEDYRAPALNLTSLYGPEGWPNDPSRIFFGGDDGTLFRDFQVTVDGPHTRFGDLNSDGSVNNLDWAILRTNQETDLSGLSFRNSYFRGDLNLDQANEFEDFKMFKALYDDINGPGSFDVMAAGVPEPSMLALSVCAGLTILPRARRALRRA